MPGKKLNLCAGPSLAIVFNGGVSFADKVGELFCICRKIWKFADSAPIDGKKNSLFWQCNYFSRAGGVTPHTPPIATDLPVWYCMILFYTF